MQEIDLIFMSSTLFLIFGPMLRQFGAEKDGSEDPISSLLSLLIVFLVAGRSAGRLTCSSYQGGGEGWEAGRDLPGSGGEEATTGMGRGLELMSLSSDSKDTCKSQQELFLVVNIQFNESS